MEGGKRDTEGICKLCEAQRGQRSPRGSPGRRQRRVVEQHCRGGRGQTKWAASLWARSAHCFLIFSYFSFLFSFFSSRLQQTPMDHPNIPDEPPHIPPFGFYPQEHDQSYNLAYSTPLTPYQVMHHAANQPRGSLSLLHSPIRNSCSSDNRFPCPIGHLLPDLHQQGLQQFHSLSLITPHQYQSPVFASTPPHVQIPLSNSPPPPSPDMYDPMSPPVSGSDTSADGFYHHSNSSGANSPSSSRGTSLVHRHIRYNPSPSPTSSSGRRRRARSHDSDEEDNMGVAFTENLAHSRKEATRRQRIEAEQRRRDELRDGYAKLKEVLPISNQKSSKVSLLERGGSPEAFFFFVTHSSSVLILFKLRTISLLWKKPIRSCESVSPASNRKCSVFVASTKRSRSQQRKGPLRLSSTGELCHPLRTRRIPCTRWLLSRGNSLH